MTGLQRRLQMINRPLERMTRCDGPSVSVMAFVRSFLICVSLFVRA